MEVFIIMVSNLEIIGLALLRIRVGNEYSPCALLVGSKSISDSTSVEVTGSNRKEQQGERSVRYSRKSCLECGSMDANVCPTDAKCWLRMLGISAGFLVIPFPFGFLIADIMRLLLDFLLIRLLISSHVFFMLHMLLEKNL